jgi:hypothetical protein
MPKTPIPTVGFFANDDRKEIFGVMRRTPMQSEISARWRAFSQEEAMS